MGPDSICGYLSIVQVYTSQFGSYGALKIRCVTRVSRFFGVIEKGSISRPKGHLFKNEILSDLTTLGTPQQHGITKRRNKTLLVVVRSLVKFLGLAIFPWGYVLHTGKCMLNFVPIKSAPKTLQEL